MTPKKIVATAPCRVDLAGGTLDIWPLYLFHPGAVTLNFAVNVLTRCEITPLAKNRIEFESLDTRCRESFANAAELMSAKSFEHPLAGYLCRYFFSHADASRGGFRLTTHSESPAGAGISGSSAMMIATTAALSRFFHRKITKEQIRVLAQNVEAQLIKVPTGCQDYYPALYGGVSAIELSAEGIHREALSVPATEIDSRFVLVYTGAPRQSGINNWEVFKAHIDGDKRVFKNFEQIADIATLMRLALIRKDWPEVLRLIREEWKLRKTNAPGITTPKIEKLIAVAMKNGARAAKVCGAGGGGCLVLVMDPDVKMRVAQEVESEGGQILDCKVATRGVTTTAN